MSILGHLDNPVYVVAGCRREVINYAELHGIEPAATRYIDHPGQLMGIVGGDLILVGSYYLNKHIDDIRRKATDAGMTIKHSIS